MKQPTEQQLKDPKWWDVWAPDGANYYAHGSIEPFERFDDSGWSYFDRDICEWFEMGCKTMAEREQIKDTKLYKRPQPAQWKGPQDGLPPKGTNCRVVQTINNYMVCKDATITYQGNGVGCYINNDNGMEYSVSHHDYSFRLIETERNKATYELARDLGDICPMPEVVNKVIDLGYRKPIDRAEAYDRAIKSVGSTTANDKAVSLILDALGYKE